MALMRSDMMFVLFAAVYYGSTYVSASAGPSVFSSIQVGLQMEKEISESIRNEQIFSTDFFSMPDVSDIFGEAFSSSGLLIIISELGDKTFFIAALLAMKYEPLFVFLGSFGALAAMTVLSATMGLVLPAFLPREYTHWTAVALFVFFGVKMSCEALQMYLADTGEGASDELEEVETALESSDAGEAATIIMQAFTLTFLAEWGDRSQIATIALAAAKNPIGVALGGIAGHCCCTTLAVMGGRVLATQISERCVVAAGGALFLAFAAHGSYTGP